MWSHRYVQSKHIKIRKKVRRAAKRADVLFVTCQGKNNSQFGHTM